jgi:endonuclease VIII-like 1
MPELSEIKIMSDFINHVATHDSFFEKIDKSTYTKVKTEIDIFDGGVFTINAKSRGKELMIHMELIGGDINGAVVKNLICTMGMSGNWIYIKGDSPKLEQAFKHGHLRLKTTRGNWLILYDPRRFAKWKWVDGWSKGRGPCPLTEYDKFIKDIKIHYRTHKNFNRPLNEILMNQRWFNGVGNYIRSEVLFRTNIDPFKMANSLTEEELDVLLKTIHACFRDSYALGGGQLKDWFNPNGTDGKNFNEWIKCYGNKEMSKVIDKLGRTFWYNPIWDSSRKLTYPDK